MIFYLALITKLSEKVRHDLMLCVFRSLATNDEKTENSIEVIILSYRLLIKYLTLIFIPAKPAKTTCKTPQRKTSLEKLLKWQSQRPT